MSFDTEKFIRYVKARNPIWQSRHPFHKNRYVLNKSWKEIAEVLQMDDKVLRKKWKNLRDQYIKEIKKYPTDSDGIEDNDCLGSTWIYFPLMKFMKDDVVIPEVKDAEEMLDEDVEEPSSTPPLMESPSTEIQNSTTQINTNSIHTEFIELEKKKVELLQMKLFQHNNEENCEDLLFFRSLLPYMRELTPLQKLRARNKITEVLMEEMDKTYTEQNF